jgi:acyl-coenzyme A thioesterase PaaI-like protein
MNLPATHLGIDHRLCGTPTRVEPGMARVHLTATRDMAVDDRGLVHGGFVFGMADYAAMLAVNDPNVVLGGAEVRFAAPVQVGEELTATARVVAEDGRRRGIEVTVVRNEDTVFGGTFACFVLERHVLER